jgi:hypothetical protein
MAKDPEAYRAYSRARGQHPTTQSRIAEYKRANPEKVAAQQKVTYALKTGRLVRGKCQVCGTDIRIHAHHEDYSKPLDVWWLCAVHHKARHKVLRTIEQGETT